MDEACGLIEKGLNEIQWHSLEILIRVARPAYGNGSKICTRIVKRKNSMAFSGI